MNKNKNKNKNKGFTLLELLLSAGFVTLAGVAVYALYDVTSSTSSSVEEMKRLSTYVKAVEGATATNGDFSHINMSNFEDLGIAIDRKFGLTNIESTTPTSLSFTYSNIIPSLCTKFVTNVLSANMGLTTSVNGQGFDRVNYKIDEVAAACASDSSSSVIFTLSSLNNSSTLTNENAVPGYNYNPGNPGSVVVGNWGDPVVVPTIVGQTSTNIAGGGGGFGYTGGLGSVGNNIGGGNSVPSTLPPSVGVRPPNPWDGAYVPPPPVGARVSSAALAFRGVAAGAGAVRVVANRVVTTGVGLRANSNYRVEYLSQSFNLTSANPVVMSAQAGGMDEIFGNVYTDWNGAFTYNVNTPEDVSVYFGGATVPRNSPMFSFLRNTLPNVPVYVDVLTRDTNQIVAQTTIYPTFISSLASNLVGKFIEVTPLGGGNGAPYGQKSILTSYDGETISLSVIGIGGWNNAPTEIPVCSAGPNSYCAVPTGMPYDLATLYHMKNGGQAPPYSPLSYGNEDYHSYSNGYHLVHSESGLTYYMHNVWVEEGDSTRVDQLTNMISLSLAYLESLPMGRTGLWMYATYGPDRGGDGGA